MVRKIIGAGLHPGQQFAKKKCCVNAFIVAALTAPIVEAHKLGDLSAGSGNAFQNSVFIAEKQKDPLPT
jgi:hypothetical protein